MFFKNIFGESAASTEDQTPWTTENKGNIFQKIINAVAELAETELPASSSDPLNGEKERDDVLAEVSVFLLDNFELIKYWCLRRLSPVSFHSTP